MESQAVTMKSQIHFESKMRRTAKMSKTAPKIPQWFIDLEKEKFFQKGGEITKLDPFEPNTSYSVYNSPSVSHVLVDLDLMSGSWG